METRALVAFAFAAWLGACSGDDVSGPSGSGAGGSGAGGNGAGASSSTSTSTSSLGTTTCDDIGVCVDGAELGCEACALSGSCADEKLACDEEPTDACAMHDACTLPCPPDDPLTVDVDERLPCTQACDAAYPTGMMLLAALRGCVYCDECPLSCTIESAMCVTDS